MRVSTVIADIIQIINRRHSDLQNLDLDDHTQYLDVVGSRPPGKIKSGTDAGKPSTPSVGDIYLATDTNKLYTCVSAGVWSRADWIVIPSGSVQGDILIRDATGWTRLPAGVSGQGLKTQGAGQNPIWDAFPDSKAEASEVLRVSADTERTVTLTAYTRTKEIRVDYYGTYRVKFDLRQGTAGYNAYARIYRNGVAYGTERITSSSTYTTYTEDLIFYPGDLVQLYQRIDSYTSIARNFRLYYDLVSKQFGTVILD